MAWPRVKKRWGQHFLCDKGIAQKIVAALSSDTETLVEIGPGRGVLTVLLVARFANLYLVEIDKELTAQLRQTYPSMQERIIEADFLQLDPIRLPSGPLTIVGNFPYNISSSIFFSVLEMRQQVREVVCVIQKEVATRLTTPAGSRVGSMLGVLLQAFYDLSHLFDVPPQASVPPPRVHSSVVRLRRNNVRRIDCDERLFFRLVKKGFQQRRKTLRNALKAMLPTAEHFHPLLDKRAEQLSVADFVALTQRITTPSKA